MKRKDFSLTAKIVDEFGKTLFKLNSVPIDKGLSQLIKYVNSKLK